MSSDSFLLLGFHAPVSFSLSLHGEPVMSPFGNDISAVTGYVSVECFGVDVVLFEFFEVCV